MASENKRLSGGNGQRRSLPFLARPLRSTCGNRPRRWLTSDPTAGASCAVRQHRISISLAREGLQLTQYLVEPGCTPSRAALMTGQYSIRNGLSLIIVPGSPSTLSKNAVTMGELFKGAGYATAIFGKWLLALQEPPLAVIAPVT